MLKKLDFAEKRTLIAWFIIGIVVVILIALFYYEFEIKENNKNIDKNYSILNDINRYYTVRGAVIKYYSYISAKDYESIIKILDQDYVKENGLTVENINNIVTDATEPISFSTRLICSKNLGNGKVSYLVSGFEEDMFSGNRMDNKYYKLILDGNNLLFSITPIEEKDFGGECKDE